MLNSLGQLLADRKNRPIQPEARVAIEHWLQSHLKSDQVYCVAVTNGCATIRVGSPTLYQEVRLQEYDLTQALMNDIGYTLTSLTLVTSY